MALVLFWGFTDTSFGVWGLGGLLSNTAFLHVENKGRRTKGHFVSTITLFFFSFFAWFLPGVKKTPRIFLFFLRRNKNQNLVGGRYIKNWRFHDANVTLCFFVGGLEDNVFLFSLFVQGQRVACVLISLGVVVGYSWVFFVLRADRKVFFSSKSGARHRENGVRERKQAGWLVLSERFCFVSAE
ncbi:hypothetical protein B0T20DRAFT_170789 [Sordaria brevicollis]|uniref:Uncharacterized protein n=1 Tax=Sordaria brevicollis TaxID=83679 RepID=A0AAE0UD63_SORBR|nr:hypothetical protein B0T20DRAFT_170789 [Sordaria brevicollis]